MTTITIKEYAETVMKEAGFTQDAGEVERYVTGKAKDTLHSRSGGIDNETVKAWILECRDGVPSAVKYKQDKPRNAEEVKRDAKKVNDKKMGENTYMESLF